MNRFDGRRVLITGGGSGIGQATVLRLLSEGGRVVAADVSEAGLEDTRTAARHLSGHTRLQRRQAGRNQKHPQFCCE
jgi:NAD(P)-dependent dehydrogenase (short-subunit alcohol dehydrogenase family)